MRKEDEMRKQVDKANETIEEGSNYPGLSYEQGVKDALEWALGDTDAEPIED